MIRTDSAEPVPTRALVVFTDGQDIWWLRLLRPGFRHVLVALHTAGHWLIVNPLAHVTRVDLVTDRPGLDLAAWFRDQGHTVVETRTRVPPLREAPWSPMTCVEVVKRLLGLHARWTLTPHALYRRLAAPDEAARFLRTGSGQSQKKFDGERAVRH